MIALLAKLPSELRPIIAAFWTQPKFFDAIVSQAESLPRSAAQVSATGDYDDVPSVVLSASSSSPSQMKGREALARLSFQGNTYSMHTNLRRSTAVKYSRRCKTSSLIARRPVCTPEHLPIRLERISPPFPPFLKQCWIVLQLQQCRRNHFRGRHVRIRRNRKARRFAAV